MGTKLIDTPEATPVEEMEQQEMMVEQQEPAIPPKYRDKSTAELIAMHQDVERAFGKQGAEYGELKKVVDSYIHNQTAEVKTEEPKQEIDFFADPEKAVEQLIDRHPKVVEAEKTQQSLRHQQAHQQLMQTHPDTKDIVADARFQEWIAASPVRQRDFRNADQNYDFERASELMSLWKERQQSVAQTVTNGRKQQVKAASTGNTRGSTTPSSKQTFHYLKLKEMQANNPKMYTALNDEILKAYAEGRVKR